LAAPAPVGTSAPTPVASPPAATVAAPPATVPSPAATARAGAATHTVRFGETLWSIAQDQLGRGASAAEIERMVARLWRLNGAVIGTGDPSVIYPGQRLRLR